jgi:hypothetical protein
MYSGAMMPSAAAADPFFRGASSAARPLSSFLRSLFSIVNDPATGECGEKGSRARAAARL